MQIVEGIREGKKVRQRTVAHLGVIKSKKDLEKLKDLADKLVERLEKEGLEIDPKVELNKLKHTKTVYDGFRNVVSKLIEMTGLQQVFQKAQKRREQDVLEVLELIISQRFANPSSKLRTFERQDELGFGDVTLQSLYRVMDDLVAINEAIQTQVFQAASTLSAGVIDCFFFDVTTLYFESVSQDDLKDFGFSKDQKHHSVQIVLALVVNADGLPLAYETFRGNLAETKTLIPVLEKLRSRFSITNVTVVCDRGLASTENVVALQDAKFHFVIASKLKSMSKKLNLNSLSEFQELEGQETFPKEDRVLVRTLSHPQYEETELVITYSPSRAKKDKYDREKLIRKLKLKISDVDGEKAIKKVVSNNGYKKFMAVKEGSEIILNEKAIEEDEKWDGFHGLAVSKSAQLNPRQALTRYRDLWRVEETFRIAKNTLKTRPIFHWKPERIKAHVLLCFITLLLERFLEVLLANHGTPLTPDQIRHSLMQIHTVHFSNGSGTEGKMESSLTPEALAIYQTLKLPCERSTSSVGACCA